MSRWKELRMRLAKLVPHVGRLAGPFLVLIAIAAGPARDTAAGPTAVGRRGMVVSVSAPATAIGVDVLRRGGNAVDAAVAVAFALAVTWPEAGNIGGGGFMLVYPCGKAQPVVIDYRESAPAAASRDMFAHGPLLAYRLVGVPGTVRGLALAHQRFGKLPWHDLVRPAVRLAEDGFAVNTALAISLEEGLQHSGYFPELRRVLGADGGRGCWMPGDRLVQKELARTLRRIAEDGPDAFYTGNIAGRIVAEMQAGGGLITRDDLAGYQAKVRKPVHGTYRGYDIYGPPPPSSGGICLTEMLNTLEPFDLRGHGCWSSYTLHRVIEAMRRAYLDRARYLGDPDWVTVPEHLLSQSYGKKLAESIHPLRATRSLDLAADIPLAPEGGQTTHFSVLDKDGMAVSNTYTLEESFGSKVMVRGAGFLLNNEMGDFNPRPGVTALRGIIGTPANEVAPHKRMLSSMTPVVVARDGKVVLVTGSPGGRTIINTVLCVLMNVIDFDMPLREAVAAPRLHHEWLPDVVRVEAGLMKDHSETLAQLRAMGHAIWPKPREQGDAHSIRVDPRTGRYEGAADRRLDGSAAGY
jgi:gamma-glutamyltranspeptidase/glutathione hydrolase